MFAAAANRRQLFNLIELIVILRRPQTMKPASRPAIDRNIKAAEGEEQALRTGDLRTDALNLGGALRANRRRGDAIEALAVLIAGDEAALRIGSEADPR